MIDFETLCEKFALGELIGDVEPQQGGSLHQVWRVSTKEKKYIIKKYNALNLELLEGRILPVEQSNRIANAFDLDSVILVDNQSKFLIHPWIDGECVYTVDAKKAYNIGKYLKFIQTQKIDLELPMPRWGGVDMDHWRKNITLAQDKNYLWAKKYHENFEFFSRMSEQAQRAQKFLLTNTCISHRDISPSNVVWCKNGTPTLIDWDFSGPINPELELFIVAINFSFQNGRINQDIFDAVLRGYGLSDFDVSEDIIGGYFGYGLDWLEFNIERALASPEQSEIASWQLSVCLKILMSVSEYFNTFEQLKTV